jgi:hypothetical protein
MVLALFGFTLLQYLDVSMYFFSFSWLLFIMGSCMFVCLFVCLFSFFFKRFIILQLSCGNYEAVSCKIRLSDTVIVCHQDLQ